MAMRVLVMMKRVPVRRTSTVGQTTGMKAVVVEPYMRSPSAGTCSSSSKLDHSAQHRKVRQGC